MGWHLFPAYETVLVPTTEGLLNWLHPHELSIELDGDYPWLSWSFSNKEIGRQSGRISFLLLVYNTVLYLTVLVAVKQLSTKRKLWLGVSGLPFVFAFHLFDLALTLESRALSIVQKQHYDFLADFGLWFSLVKAYNFISIMAVKQVALLGLLALQYHVARRVWGDGTE